MSNGKIDYLVTLRDGITGVLGKIRSGFGSLLGGVRSFAGGAVSALTSLPALLAGGSGLAGIGKSIKEAFKVESMTTQFKVLLGNLDAAKTRIKDLQQFSAATPFQLDGIAQASRSMHVFSGGVLGGIDSLKVAGDAAAATGRQIEDVGFWYGRAYSAIKNGQPFGEVAMRLQEMGIMTGEGRAKIKRLAKSGADTKTVFAALEAEFTRFSGGMEELSKTGDGLVSTLKDNIKLGMAEFGSALTNAAKGGLQTLIDKISELQADGTFAAWGARAAQIVGQIVGAFTWLRNTIAAAWNSAPVQAFVSTVSTAVTSVIGIFKGLADGTVGLGKILGELGMLVGTQLKLGIMTAINWLAQGLQATIAGLTHGIGGAVQMLTTGQFWAGLAQVIIGSLGAVGAFLIRIFTEPLVLLQAGIDTIMKGMLNTMAGMGGNKDEYGTGRLGRKLGIAVQENDYEKNLADARKNSWLLNTAAQGANDSKDILDKGLKNLGEAMAPTGNAMLEAARANMTGPELFDTSSARADRDAAASAIGRYGDDIKLPSLAAMPDVSAPAVAAVAAAVAKAAPDLSKYSTSSKKDIDMAARQDWLQATRAGRTPDEEIAENTKEIANILKEIKKDGGIA
jgi:hypothetical protein